MSKVYLRAQISGVRDGVDWPARGEAVNVSEEEAAELIQAGLAQTTPVDVTPGPIVGASVEAATVDEAVETAEVPTKPARGRKAPPKDAA